MGYDISLTVMSCPTCGHAEMVGPELPSPTYNLLAIFDLALTGGPLASPEVPMVDEVLFRAKTDRPRGLRILHGMSVRDSEPLLLAAYGRLRDPDMRTQFRALEPSNGWGTLDSAVVVIDMLLKAAENNPSGTWSVS